MGATNWDSSLKQELTEINRVSKNKLNCQHLEKLIYAQRSQRKNSEFEFYIGYVIVSKYMTYQETRVPIMKGKNKGNKQYFKKAL